MDKSKLRRAAASGSLYRRVSDRGKAANRYLIVLLGLGVGPILLVGLLNVGVDPLQFLRRAEAGMSYLSSQERLQAPGMARHADYDFAIMGPSTMGLFTQNRVQRHLGGKPLKLTLDGSVVWEQRMLLEVALRSGKPKRVLWGIELAAMTSSPDGARSDNGTFPVPLYLPDPAGWLPYVFSLETLRRSIDLLATLAGVSSSGEFMPENGPEPLPDRPGREALLSDYVSHRGRCLVPALTGMGENVALNMDRNILAPILAHPEVAFLLVLPPSSWVAMVSLRRYCPASWQAMLLLRRLVRQASRLPNVTVYDFQTAPELVADIDAYTDMLHFGQKVAERMSADIAAGRHRVDANSPDEPDFERLVDTFGATWPISPDRD